MRTYTGGKEINATIALNVRLHVDIEPGAWVMDDDGAEASVTAVEGIIDDKCRVHLVCKGVHKRPNGTWHHVERLLLGPVNSAVSWWARMPPDIQEAVRDAYTLALHDRSAPIAGGPNQL